MNIYKKILIILIPFLFLNIAYNLNSYSFEKDILNTMTYQVFKDLKLKDTTNPEDAKITVEKYIQIVLEEQIKDRNNKVGEILRINIIIIAITLLFWLIHYTIHCTNKKEILIKSLIVLSSIWLLLLFPKSYEASQFIFKGIIPIILIFGAIWVYSAYSKNKTSN